MLFHRCTSMTDTRVVFHQLTLLHARCDGNEGHEAAEPQVDPQQGLVELAGHGVCVVLVHESEGHGGDSVEEEGGTHHRDIPTLVLCCSGQPEVGGQREGCSFRWVFSTASYRKHLFTHLR